MSIGTTLESVAGMYLIFITIKDFFSDENLSYYKYLRGLGVLIIGIALIVVSAGT